MEAIAWFLYWGVQTLCSSLVHLHLHLRFFLSIMPPFSHALWSRVEPPPPCSKYHSAFHELIGSHSTLICLPHSCIVQSDIILSHILSKNFLPTPKSFEHSQSIAWRWWLGHGRSWEFYVAEDGLAIRTRPILHSCRTWYVFVS